jgi:hypothetical protein
MITSRNPAITRDGWPSGLWDGEPDFAYWHDATTGLPCQACRSIVTGSWCGYVAVKPDHPWHGLDYQAEGLNDLDVHGGLTYSDHQDVTQTNPYFDHIELWNTWWFGFDCAHSDDTHPAFVALLESVAQHYHAQAFNFGCRYRTLEYVQGQCAVLAAQLMAATSSPRSCQ